MKRGMCIGFVIMSALLFVLHGCTMPSAHVVEIQIPREVGVAEPLIFFCPGDDCEDVLYTFLDEAEHSIDCALYDVDLPRIIDVLDNKSEEIRVRVITDDDNYENIEHLNYQDNEKSNHGAGEPRVAPSEVASEERSDDSRREWLDFGDERINVKHDNRSALMHNKFCIVDERFVFTGSFNPTENGAYKNNNNMVIIESMYIAGNYEDEFEEMWNGVFGRGEKTKTPVVHLNGKRVEVYFCPEDECADKPRSLLHHRLKTIETADDVLFERASS